MKNGNRRRRFIAASTEMMEAKAPDPFQPLGKPAKQLRLDKHAAEMRARRILNNGRGSLPRTLAEKIQQAEAQQ